MPFKISQIILFMQHISVQFFKKKNLGHYPFNNGLKVRRKT